jgi:hypothetical protein
LAIGRGVAG